MTDLKIFRLPELKNRVGLSTSTIYSMMRRNAFPRPIPLTDASNGAVGWLPETVDAWLQGRKAAVEALNAEKDSSNVGRKPEIALITTDPIVMGRKAALRTLEGHTTGAR